jgi:hypothetical protein
MFQEIPMNKADLITTLRTEADLSKSEAESVVNLFFDQIANAMASCERVEILGLCRTLTGVMLSLRLRQVSTMLSIFISGIDRKLVEVSKFVRYL